ncbi:phage recombination protein Bet [Piscirickettsia salmonis]|uniref:phage recombination protein Bet n=1 Tax=Piscirickettsia salmonis TaxID=1238 RepID=UPI0007C8AE39|nr:RecT family protein [Piscirickettsiaceae bacterium NZ-RLO1]
MEMQTQNKASSLVRKFANTYGVEHTRLLDTLKTTVFNQKDITTEQMMVLLVVADRYGLDPFTKEIYAFSPKEGREIIPIVSVDGWSKIINSNPNYDGAEFFYSDVMAKPGTMKVECHEWVECAIYRKGCSHPVRVREHLDEVYKEPKNKNGQYGSYTPVTPWQTHPKRMLRHRAFIQAGRIALGFGGIYDHDEGEQIVEAKNREYIDVTPSPALQPQGAIGQETYTDLNQPLNTMNNVTDLNSILEEQA